MLQRNQDIHERHIVHAQSNSSLYGAAGQYTPDGPHGATACTRLPHPAAAPGGVSRNDSHVAGDALVDDALHSTQASRFSTGPEAPQTH